MMDEQEEVLLSYADREKISQLLDRYKHLSADAPLSSATRCFSIDSTSPDFISDLFRELENIDIEDLSREGTAKNLSNFLVELTEIVPGIVSQNVYHLLPHLDDDCFGLRIAILTVLAELIQHQTGSLLDEEQTEAREKFLLHLEEHVHDKNAFVRAKVVQLWVKLAGNRCLPESRFETLLPVIVGRLLDKASTVRKWALQFLTVTLKTHPDTPTIKTLYEENVLPQVSIMIRLQQTSDVLEAVELVVTCNMNAVVGASGAFWECCRLIWSKEQAVKDVVVRAFQRLFLSYNATQERTRDEAVAKSLMALVLVADLNRLTSLEEIVFELTKRRLISRAVCQILWEHFTMRFPDGNSYQESKAALKLIGMMAKSEKAIVKDNMEILIEFGLGDRALLDFELAADAIYVLEKLSIMPKAKGEEAIRMVPYRLNDEHELLVNIQTLLIQGYTRLDDSNWTPMMERAVRLVFTMADHPNQIAAVILRDILVKFKDNADGEIGNGMLVRLVALVGQVALQTFINLDVAVCRELKRRNLLKEEMRSKNSAGNTKIKQESTPERSKTQSSRRKMPMKTPRSKVSIVSNVTPTVNLCDEELNAMIGATADDEEYELVNRLCEEEVLADHSLLGQLAKMIIHICQNPHKFPEENIQAAASLAISKIMLVSSKFAETNLQLFFTMLDRSEWPAVRANLVIAVGDLSFRFPNLVEPWTPIVYGRLRDSDLNVRLNCLLILNHLILNDMLKPKGFVADIAQCTLDGNIRIANLAKKFFVEYSAKGNALYNLLPEIISRLSDKDSSVPFDDFKTVLKFLFALIHKERQVESLVEKLCQRFLLTNCVDQCRRLSYCLSLLTYNERMIRKLQENIPCFASKLGDGRVYSDFHTILNSARKSCKQECKELLDELEEKLFHLNRKYDDDLHPPTAPWPPVTKTEIEYD